MKTFIIENEQRRTFVQNLIAEMPTDGSMTVVTKQTDKSATAAQRRLQWMWNGEVSTSGLGRDDTKEAVHVTAKWMFARPILLRDDEVFGAVYAGFQTVVEQIEEGTRAEFWRDFTKDFISTEKMTRNQRAEYLTEFQRYWTGKGVELTDPALQGLDQRLGYRVAA
jgi:hypothetical protein